MVERRWTEGLKIYFMNAQSIVNKMDELRVIVGESKPDIVGVTEAWTNELIGDSLLKLDGYDLVAREDRNDTQRGRGGGLLLYAKEDVNIWKKESNHDFNQMTTVQVKCGGEDISIHLVYRSPNSTRENDESLAELVKAMRGINILFGDFNLPDIDWARGTAGSRGQGFYEATCERFMEQHVTDSTHISGNTLDLVLSDREGVIKTVKMEGRIGKSDHEIISFSICVDAKRINEHGASRDYNRAKYEAMRNDLDGVDWVEELRGKYVDGIWETIKGRLHDLVETHVPFRTAKMKNQPRWMDNEI